MITKNKNFQEGSKKLIKKKQNQSDSVNESGEELNFDRGNE